MAAGKVCTGIIFSRNTIRGLGSLPNPSVKSTTSTKWCRPEAILPKAIIRRSRFTLNQAYQTKFQISESPRYGTALYVISYCKRLHFACSRLSTWRKSQRWINRPFWLITDTGGEHLPRRVTRTSRELEQLNLKVRLEDLEWRMICTLMYINETTRAKFWSEVNNCQLSDYKKFIG